MRYKQTRWSGNSKPRVGENLFVCLRWTANLSRFFFLCFYLIMSGLWCWLVLLPQSVNNDLAAAAAGCCCQAFDKHSLAGAHITPWLASFHWLPVKYRFDFKIFSISQKVMWSGSDLTVTGLLSPHRAWWVKSNLKTAINTDSSFTAVKIFPIHFRFTDFILTRENTHSYF